MKIYDISVPISGDMPVWPGDTAVNFKLTSEIDAGDNANVSHISLSAHTGTHVDAPFHFLPEGVTLDAISLNIMIGPAYVLDLPDIDLITADVLKNAEFPQQIRRLIFKTRNSEIWARGEKEFQTDFVAVSPDGAQYLVERGIKMVGIDYLSIAPFQQSRPTHEILLKSGVFVLEGVNLSAVAPGQYTLYCLPLNLQGVDGAPARVILIDE
jgi:arylformamidase